MSDRIALATISTANYWPYTAVMLESLARVCPEWEVYVLALNEIPQSDLAGRVNIVRAEDIWGEDTELCRARMNLFEWACASKPRLLRYVLDQTEASLAMYADSDTEFFAPPHSICVAAGSIILTPNVSAIQECESAAWERTHLHYGSFNGGFLAVRDTAEGRSFLQWWDDRITRYCCTEPWLDIFSDQRWLDLVPGLFSGVVIDRSPTLNVAVWNVRGRELRLTGGTYWVGDAPLCFFHFHRVRLDMDMEAYLAEVNHHPAVSQLVKDYLEKAKRHARTGPVDAERHDRQADGALLPPVVYRAIRDTLAEGELSFDAREVSTSMTEYLRQISFANGRLRARLRVLAYHSAHAKHSLMSEPNIDRYQHSWLHRKWIDLWYFCNAPQQVQMPLNWIARSAWARHSRQGVATVLRALRLH
jgi:hypothetical protein